MNTVILLLGGNIGNVAQNFEYASLYIEALAVEGILKSKQYESKPWGFVAEQNFLNQVIIIKTGFSAEQLLKRLQIIENIFSRKRSIDGYESRKLDIDILFFNNEIIDTPELQIPHPRLHLRNFTLKPLVEIMPNFVHPVVKKTMLELLSDSQDESMVNVVEVY